MPSRLLPPTPTSRLLYHGPAAAHTNHHVTNHHVTNHNITNHRTNHNVTNHNVTNHHVTTCHVTTRNVTACHVTTCQALPHPRRGASLDSRSPQDAKANTDDGTCAPDYPGCTNPAATNYGSQYTTDDGSCSVGGCLDPTDDNYSPEVTFSLPNSCASSSSRRKMMAALLKRVEEAREEVRRQMMAKRRAEAAAKRRAQSGEDDGGELIDPANFSNTTNATITFTEEGCLDPRALDWSALATVHVASMCTYGTIGCMTTNALNYMMTATHPGECVFPNPGCMIPQDTHNFDSAATINTGCRCALRRCSDSLVSYPWNNPSTLTSPLTSQVRHQGLYRLARGEFRRARRHG